MKYLLQVASAIGGKAKDEDIHKITQNRQSEITQEITSLSDSDIDKLLGALLPQVSLVDDSFYDVLQDLQHHTKYGPHSKIFVARLWASFYNQLPQDKQKLLLNSLLKKNLRGFWTAIHSFKEFCSRVKLDSQFAAQWFCQLAERVKQDMASGDFFDGICEYAKTSPSCAMEIFENYVSKKLDDLKIHLASLLLGTARSYTSDEFKKKAVDKWDTKLQKSRKIDLRLVYYKSLICSFNTGITSVQELASKLSKMLKGADREVSEVFNIVGRCLISNKTNSDFVQFALDWYTKNASSQIPDYAKYHVINAIWLLCSNKEVKDRETVISRANNLVLAVQPIPIEHEGTWRDLEYYLVDRLQEDQAKFESVLAQLIELNPDGFITQLKRSNYLRSEWIKTGCDEFVTKLFLSCNSKKIRLGKLIFQETNFDKLSVEILLEATENQLEFALLEFMRSPFLGERTSKFLLQLEPRFKTIESELKETFKNEMVLQAINYPGVCLDSWKKIENPSELLKEVVASAEKYFERLNALKDSPAISFTFPGCKEAAEREASEFSNKISREAKEKSIFANLAKNIHIIYGSRWAVMTVDGKLGQATDFNKFGHSMEFPRVEIIDPEGMAIRRIQSRM